MKLQWPQQKQLELGFDVGTLKQDRDERLLDYFLALEEQSTHPRAMGALSGNRRLPPKHTPVGPVDACCMPEQFSDRFDDRFD